MTTGTLRFGLIADVHQDFMYKAEERLQAFIDRMNEQHVDFIIQLGDFCYPLPENIPFVQIWEQFKGPAYHVLGNHDMDKGDKQTIIEFLGMPSNYYSFDCGDYHFAVLDANYLKLGGQYRDYSHGNYFSYPGDVDNIPDEQLEWLRLDLEGTNKHTIIFCHQSLEEPYAGSKVGVHNSTELREVLSNANKAAGFRKVIACMNGHCHVDGTRIIDDIYYIQLNSASFFYMGPEFNVMRYSPEVTEKYPILACSVPYEEVLYAIVTLEEGSIDIRGKETAFIGLSPLESGHSGINAGYAATAKISDRRLSYESRRLHGG